MAEYIEREALMLKLKEYVTLCGYDYVIRNAPAADVAPVVHGRWLKTEEPLGWHEIDCVECSACHESWVVDEDYGYDFLDFWNYCPNCGAHMKDGE